MLQPERVLETVGILKGGVGEGLLINLVINNRAGGNSPLIAQQMAEKFFGDLRF